MQRGARARATTPSGRAVRIGPVNITSSRLNGLKRHAYHGVKVTDKEVCVSLLGCIPDTMFVVDLVTELE